MKTYLRELILEESLTFDDMLKDRIYYCTVKNRSNLFHCNECKIKFDKDLNMFVISYVIFKNWFGCAKSSFDDGTFFNLRETL